MPRIRTFQKPKPSHFYLTNCFCQSTSAPLEIWSFGFIFSSWKNEICFSERPKKTKHISNKMLMRFYFRHLVYGLHSLRLYIILRKHLQNDCRNKKHTVFHFEARERFLFQHEDKIICVSQHISKSGIVSFTMIKLTVHQTTNLCSTWWIY